MNPHDDEQDPTGMRALLRGLPDPGPMPDDLVHRIQASLAELEPLNGAGDSDVSANVSRGTSSDRPSWWTRHGSHAAIAAVVLIGGGALASVPFRDGLGSSADSADSAASGTSEQGQDLSKTYSTPDPDAAAPLGDPARRAAGEAVLGPVAVRLSDRSFSTSNLAAQVASGTSGSPVPTMPSLAAESPGIGPIGTETGVRSCLVALGLPRATRADVELSTVNEAPAAVLVVTLGRERTAYAVGRDCTTGNPSLLAGPVTLP